LQNSGGTSPSREQLSPQAQSFQPGYRSALKEIHMDLTALLIILLIVLGGGFYGRGLWF
jgi:hypothetical protein